MYCTECVATNYDIYLGKDIAHKQNSGYEQNLYNEEQCECDEIVRVAKETALYIEKTNNYIMLSKGDIIKRIARVTNEVDGKKWDKVRISNGEEGYVLSADLEILENQEEYENINFKYNERICNVYFSTKHCNINLADYPYFLVGIDSNTGKISIFYSQKPITAKIINTDVYYNYGSALAFKVVINNNGDAIESAFDMSEGVKIDVDKYIATNRSICDNNWIVFKSCVFDKDGEVSYTTEGSWDDMEIEKKTKFNIIMGEDEYNSMTDSERTIKYNILSTEHEMLCYAAMAAKLKYPNAADALMYFLEKGRKNVEDEIDPSKSYPYEEGIYKEGHTMRKISLQNAINENGNMKEKLNKVVENVKEVAEKFNIPENSHMTFYNTIQDSGDTGGYSTSDAGDWFLAIGRYRIKVQCTVARQNGNYELEMRYGLEDYYDWREDGKRESLIIRLFTEGDDALKNEVFEQLESFHRAGLSRNYTNYGEVIYNTTWTAEQ